MGPDVATLPSRGRATPGRRSPPSGRAVVALALVGLTVALVRPLRRVEVVGGSMAPTFLPGDRLLVLAPLPGRPVRAAPGDVVAVADPRDRSRILVKRVVAVDRAAGTVEVRGDDPSASTDSRHFGPVPRRALIGRVVHRYGPPGRSGPGPWPTEYDRP